MSIERWHPISSRMTHDRPTPGTLVAYKRQVWRVIETRDVPEVDLEEGDERGSYYVIVEPPRGGKRMHMKVRRPWFLWNIVDEHYPVCVECGEPYPCLHLDAAAAGKDAADQLDRLTAIMPGCCWACGEPISARQERVSFDGPNVWLPTAPSSPAFHLRQTCRHSAARYEDAWVAADTTRPRSLLTLKCAGTVVVHGDGSAECFGAVNSDCPSVYASHGSYAACYTQTHGCPRACARKGHPGARLPRPRGLLNPASEDQLR